MRACRKSSLTWLWLAWIWALPSLAAPTNATGKGLPVLAPGAHAANQIPWQAGTVDSVFAAAQASNKPVFLYWGASWCPPCNQVKATIFNRQDFIEKSRLFLPVYLDGDSPGAQKLGARFKVRGYPTMILFSPDGKEITRLPGEVDAERYMQVLSMGLQASRPIKALLTAALEGQPQGGPPANLDDWRLLAYYAWDTDEQQLLPAREAAAALRRLAEVSQTKAPALSARFALRALAMEAKTKEKVPSPDGAAQAMRVLEDAKLTRENFDLISNYAVEIVDYLSTPQSPGQRQLSSAWQAALDRLVEDESLSRTDRLVALSAKISLAKHEPDGLSPAQVARIRGEVKRADHATSNRYARQSVISAAADALAEAGLLDDSDALLKKELKRSHSPYYFMLGLAANAKKRGDTAATLAWTAKAYAASKGPATRLQWGANYIKTLIEMAPEDEASIEVATKQVFGELKASPETFYERNLRSLERVGKNLKAWNMDNEHAAVIRRLQAQLDEICKKLPSADPSRAACTGVIG